MSYTAQQLLFDVLARIGNLPPTGMTFYGAANSINSMIFKKLLERRSDLLATGTLSAIIPAQGVSFTLPDDFYSMAEKPHAVECNSLIANMETQLTAGGLSAPNLALVQALFTTTTGALVSAIQTISGGNVQAIVDSLVHASACDRHSRLEPEYLDDDDEHNDWSWWDWYGVYGIEGIGDGWYVGGRRGRMKIISTTFYQYPKRCNDLSIKGRYFQTPGTLALPTDMIPFNGLFNETYREGVVLIVKNGLAVEDPAIQALISRDVDTVINSRISITSSRRTGRGNFI